MKTLPAFLFRAVILLLLSLQPVLAEMCESTGEYEYTHGDNESIIQAKQFCEHMALRSAIEQCALFVSSTSNIQNYQLRDDLVNTIAAAVVRNKKILDQRVNGRTVYYKVSVKIDDTQMTQAIEAERARLNPGTTPPAASTTPIIDRFEKVDPPAETVKQEPTRTEPVAKPVQKPPRMPVISGDTPRHHLAVRLGQKSMAESDDWTPVDKQGVFGVMFDMPILRLPLNLDLGFMASAKSAELEEDDDFEAYGETTELGFGVRYYLGKPEARLLPYGVVGLAITNATYELTYDDSGDEYTSTIDGSSTGLVFGGGAVFAVTPRFTLGADLRINTASVELEGEDLFGDEITFDTKSGGTTFALTAGFRF